MTETVIKAVSVWKELKNDKYILIPCSKLKGGLRVCQPKFYKTSNSSHELGETLKKCIEDYKNTPLVGANTPIIYEATGIKSNSKFMKLYSHVSVEFHVSDNLYKFTHHKKSNAGFLGTYSDDIIPENATDEEIGDLIKKAFEKSD